MITAKRRKKVSTTSITIRVRNPDREARRTVPKDHAAWKTRMSWLEAIEGWDEYDDGTGWRSFPK